jgi:hypothetical protein
LNAFDTSGGRLYAVEDDSAPAPQKMQSGGRLYAPESAAGEPEAPEVPVKVRRRRNWREIRSTAVELAGIASFSAGFGWFSPGLGMIFGGIGLVVVGFTLGLGSTGST